jgi:membrane protein implicated in regulation of membrane protease activity
VLVAWLLLGIVLSVVEMHHLAFFALFGAIGAAAAAVVAAFAPGAVAAQAAVAAVVAAAGVVAVRPYVSRAFDHGRRPNQIRGTRSGLVGGEGVTLDEVGEAEGRGHVRLYGERWLAVSGAEQSLPAGVPVVVTAVRGTTLVVWPVDPDLLADLGGASIGDATGDATGDVRGEVDGLGPGAAGPAGEDDAPDGADGRKT